MDLLAIIFVAVLANNIVLHQFLGICPFLGVSRRVETALGMGMAVIFVMTMAGLATWFIYNYLLLPFNLGYLRTITFILVIASLVQLVETVMRKVSPVLFDALGIYLPLITTNCAILGMALLNVQYEHGLVEAAVYAFSTAVGFTLALVIMSGIRERLELVKVSGLFKDAALTLITAGILSTAFMGFSGMITL